METPEESGPVIVKHEYLCTVKCHGGTFEFTSPRNGFPAMFITGKELVSYLDGEDTQVLMKFLEVVGKAADRMVNDRDGVRLAIANCTTYQGDGPCILN